MSTKQILHLQRIYGEQGTNGTLTFEGEVICRTIELPWRNNLPRLSCIPVGSYKLEKRKYTRHGEQIGIPAAWINIASRPNTAGIPICSPCLVLVGTGYYQLVNGAYYPLANGQYNALTIHQVVIP